MKLQFLRAKPQLRGLSDRLDLSGLRLDLSALCLDLSALRLDLSALRLHELALRFDELSARFAKLQLNLIRSRSFYEHLSLEFNRSRVRVVQLHPGLVQPRASVAFFMARLLDAKVRATELVFNLYQFLGGRLPLLDPQRFEVPGILFELSLIRPDIAK